MRDILIVVDMQKDFVDGALGTGEARLIAPKAAERIKGFQGPVYYTMDSHGPDYMQTQEGRRLPVAHCLKGSPGWELIPELKGLSCERIFEKPGFGSAELALFLREMNSQEPLESITLIGLCTDICVISNAILLKSFLPEVKINVDASCCAGVSPQSHLTALEAMKMCQIEIENG